MYKEMLLGCGSNRAKKLVYNGRELFQNLTTLDIEARHNPDIVWDLNNFPLPFPDDEFDEIHIYECLEHLGKQGDWKFFFDQFSDFWRILKHGGLLIGTVPAWDSEWAWGDPSHTRVFTPGCFVFLNQPTYSKQVGVTPMSDYRSHYKADFDILHMHKKKHNLEFVLQAIKPSRIAA